MEFWRKIVDILLVSIFRQHLPLGPTASLLNVFKHDHAQDTLEWSCVDQPEPLLLFTSHSARAAGAPGIFFSAHTELTTSRL